MDALGRALAAAPLPWPVNLLLLDVAQDPVGDWMHERVAPLLLPGLNGLFPRDPDRCSGRDR